MMKFVDSHCHIHFKDFDGKTDALLEKIKNANVSHLLTVGTEFDSYKKMQHLLTHDNIFGSVGIHPCSTHFTYEDFVEKIDKDLLTAFDNVDFYSDVITDNIAKIVSNFDITDNADGNTGNNVCENTTSNLAINAVNSDASSTNNIDSLVSTDNKTTSDNFNIDNTSNSQGYASTNATNNIVQFKKLNRFDIVYSFLKKTVERDSKIIAVGETGLDFFKHNIPQDIQEEVFNAHIQFANEMNLPLIIHSREAEEATLNMLKKAKNKVIFHCFTGSKKMALEAIKRGYYISFSGILTFKNAKHLHEIAAEIPLSQILIETDSPYLTPHPHRGKYPNDPSYVVDVARKIAELRCISIEEVAEATTKNFFEVANIKL